MSFVARSHTGYYRRYDHDAMTIPHDSDTTRNGLCTMEVIYSDHMHCFSVNTSQIVTVCTCRKT